MTGILVLLAHVSTRSDDEQSPWAFGMVGIHLTDASIKYDHGGPAAGELDANPDSFVAALGYIHSARQVRVSRIR